MKALMLWLALSTHVFAASYYVTQSGAGAANGTSLGNAWSVANYNASSAPTGGDSVFFSGTITSTVTPGSSGTGNGASRLILDFSGATLTTANPFINVNGKNYVTLSGGGSWNAGVYTPAGILGAIASQGTAISFNTTQSHDVTIQGFQCITSNPAQESRFILGQYSYNLLVTQNNITNVSNFYFSDSILSHDITFSNNYCSTNTNTVGQTDVIQIGDAYNVTIEGNKFVQNAPGQSVGDRHNDILQCYEKGGSNNGKPYGWIIRYNWLETAVVGGDGDSSWTILEAMKSSGGVDACKIYGNVFVGTVTNTGSNNGLNFNNCDATAVVRLYNNTFARHNGPDGTIRFQSSSGTLYSRNNVGQANSGVTGTFVDWTWTAGATWDYNWFYRWNSPSSTYTGAHGAANTDPLFTDYTGNNFSTQSGSPLRNAGDNAIGAEYNQGIAFGATWPNPTVVTRSTWDVGAYQYATDVAGDRGLTGKATLSGKATLQ